MPVFLCIGKVQGIALRGTSARQDFTYRKKCEKGICFFTNHNMQTVSYTHLPVILDLLKLAKAYDTISNHQFDITMGSVLNIWHDYREAGTLANQKNKESSIPSMKELQTAAKHSGWKHVQLSLIHILTNDAATITKVTAAPIPMAELLFLDTPINGHIPRN